MFNIKHKNIAATAGSELATYLNTVVSHSVQAPSCERPALLTTSHVCDCSQTR